MLALAFSCCVGFGAGVLSKGALERSPGNRGGGCGAPAAPWRLRQARKAPMPVSLYPDLPVVLPAPDPFAAGPERPYRRRRPAYGGFCAPPASDCNAAWDGASLCAFSAAPATENGRAAGPCNDARKGRCFASPAVPCLLLPGARVSGSSSENRCRGPGGKRGAGVAIFFL